MNRLTRNKAAEIIGVTPQTITNYVNEGLLGGFTDEKGYLYVNAEDIEKYAKKYKFIAVSQEMLDKKLADLKTARENANEEFTNLRRRIIGGKYGTMTSSVANVISTFYEVGLVPKLKGRERDILVSFIRGANIRDLSAEYNLTTCRVQQIINKACRRFYDQVDGITCNLQSNRLLNEEIYCLEDKLKVMKKAYDEYKAKHEGKPADEVTASPEILRRRICDCNFSVRILNIMRGYDIDTVGDLLTQFSSYYQLGKLRNMGRSSINHIMDFIEDNGLFFKQTGESLEHFYKRIDKRFDEDEREN